MKQTKAQLFVPFLVDHVQDLSKIHRTHARLHDVYSDLGKLVEQLQEETKRVDAELIRARAGFDKARELSIEARRLLKIAETSSDAEARAAAFRKLHDDAEEIRFIATSNKPI